MNTTSLIMLPLTVNLYGTSYSQLYINNNGNVSFQKPLSTYTPIPLNQEASQNSVDIIAPFWADVDTRNTNSSIVWYGNGTVNNTNAFGVEWVNVGYYNAHADKLLSVQLVLIDRSDIASGDFDMEFNYCQVQWDAGDVSGGIDGIWEGWDPIYLIYDDFGSPARAGFASSSGSSFEFTGSGVPGALLDSNQATGLIWNSYNSSNLGRYVFQFRGGIPQTP